MGTRRKKRPALDLPALLNESIQGYLGPRAVNKLSNDQAAKLMHAISDFSMEVGNILDDTEGLNDENGEGT